MNKIFWIAGEKSGDLHASYALKELNKLGDFHNYGVGGPLMASHGFQSLFEFEKFNVMGFVEVIKHLDFFSKVEKDITEILRKDKPSLLVLVDYPGLNLRIAKIAKSLGIKVLYYICPQFWAWKHKRVFKIRDYTDFVCCINPFESPLLNQYDVANEFVGHPVAEEISTKYTKEAFFSEMELNFNRTTIGLFPGSRRMELKRHLPLFYDIIQSNPAYQYIISLADQSYKDMYSSFYSLKNVKVITDYNYDIMKHSDFLVTKSGTTTLEAALIGTPFLIIYKANQLSVFIAKKILKIKYIGLPNLIADDLVVQELIQEEATASNILKQANYYLSDSNLYKDFEAKLNSISSLLGNKHASERVAQHILRLSNE